MAHGLSCSSACRIFPDQGWNPCPLPWQKDSLPPTPCPLSTQDRHLIPRLSHCTVVLLLPLVADMVLCGLLQSQVCGTGHRTAGMFVS